ncbi:hypothetical protein POTOM_027548 [Populus tomentosa]|uniref:Uncharacterized protein n=1 Tax=Populus tomentosa TaxID=118781 RepID=A0A8X7ZGE8_POPTO|nr:hypothetical protein POTOM_027548 [Populus tomentosa]
MGYRLQMHRLELFLHREASRESALFSFFLDTQLYQVLLFSEKMVKIGGILVCMLVVAMDVAAGILGIQAEIAQNKAC